MSDKYVAFSNFKWGLESRKSDLTTQAGALLQCINAHINAGGECEQRRSFAKDGTKFPAFTFGLESTDSGLITFANQPIAQAVSLRERNSNVAQLTVTTVLALYTIGDTVTISGEGGTGYNGTAVITAVAGSSFQYASVGPDEILHAGTGTVTVSLPTGITAQVILHPYFGSSGSFDPIDNTAILMSSVVYSANFNGKAFVVAKFANNDVFCYYNGSLVKPSRDGIVVLLTTGIESIVNLSTDLAAIINEIAGWNAYANTTALKWTPQDGSGNEGNYNLNTSAQNGSTLLETPPGVRLGIVPETNSTAGSIGAQLIDQDFPGIAAKGASVAFTLNVGTNGTVTVTAPKNSDGTGTAQLSGGAVNFITSLTLTATAVAAAINLNTFIHGYTAISSAGTVSVFAPSTWGAVTYNVTVVTTGDITTAAGVVGPTYKLTLTPSFLQVIVTSNSGGGTVAGSVTASVVGASGASSTTYAWTVISNPDNIVMSATNTPTVSFSKNLPSNGLAQGSFKCTVTDSVNVAPNKVASMTVSVSLEHDNNQ